MPQKNLRISVLLAFLVLLGVIVSPVSAGYQITAEPLGTTWVSWGQSTGTMYDASQNGMAMQRIMWDLPIGTTIDYTLWYGNGSTVSGQMIYEPVGIQVAGGGYKHTEVSMGGVSSGYDYMGTSLIGRADIAGYAKNETSDGVYQNGLIIYDSVFGLSDQKCVVFFPTSEAGAVIYKVQWSSNNPVKAGAFINPRSSVVSAASKSVLDIAWEWINYAIALGVFVYGFTVAVFVWIKFLFIDNLLLVVALWISVTMAYSAMTSRGNVFKFYTKFLRYQKTLLNFIMELWNYFIQIISAFRGIFKL
jgi:hypothetical protein